MTRNFERGCNALTLMRWHCLPWFLFVIIFNKSSAQTTTTAPITTTTNFPITTEVTTTTIASTSTPALTTEVSGTTLTVADSAAQTTTVATESANYEATTEGQASNDALTSSGGPGRGYNRFESTRSRPSANQIAGPSQEAAAQPKEKSEEKKIAWKFGRAGNNQEVWSVRPTPNNGYPLWKKEPQTPVAPEIEQSGEADSKKNTDQQAYIVWSVGQGQAPNGWTLNGGQNSWPSVGTAPATAGWASADASAGENKNPSGWNTEEWADDQSSDDEDEQEEWPEDESAPEDNTGENWNPTSAGWNSPPGNAGGWQNSPPQAPVRNVPPPNGWAPPPKPAPASGWNTNAGQGVPNNAGGWVAPQQGGNVWTPQQAVGEAQAGGVQITGNQNGGPPNPNIAWTGPSSPNSAWSNDAAANGGGSWSNSQPNGGGWNAGPPGVQNTGLSWKVYNEDTKTMENIDDNSGWKVVGDGGPDGWRLVDEKGNVEWKIENVNGEWKVTSADELSKKDNSTSVLNDATNTTAVANITSDEITTTPSSTPGWDDDKQGRYIVWKFSENGKGEARVYSGGGAEPEIWTVGDNNQYWKETINIKEGGNSGQAPWNAGGTSNSPPASPGSGSWNSNQGGWVEGSGWQNTAQQPVSNSWQNQSPQQNNDWQAGGGRVTPQVTNGWQSDSPAPAAGTSWQTGSNVSPQPTGNRGWQGGNVQQNGGNGWQQSVPAAPQTISWNNASPAQKQGSNWRNQAPPAVGSWNTANKPPQTSGGWKNTGQSLPGRGGWKNTNSPPPVGWQNGPGASQSTGGWSPSKSGRKGKNKGRWRTSNNRGRNTNGWQPNRVGNARKNNDRGSWNNRNRGGSWKQGNAGNTNPSWKNEQAPNVAPPVNVNTQKTWQNNGGQASVARGWADNGNGGQTVPYIILIKTPDESAPSAGTNNWANNGNNGNGVTSKKTKSRSANKPRNNRRSSGWKMNRAGSSGWQWNPSGGNEGWKWMDGWMGSGGGFGGWVSDKDTMYSNWRPTKGNRVSSNVGKSSTPKSAPKGNKKGTGKMVFVFGTKRSSNGGWTKPNSSGNKKGKQVIILDYTTAGDKAPKGDDGMKKDIESVIQALKTVKPTGIKETSTWKPAPQTRQQWRIV